MGIATRFVRLVKADIHGVMDQMEDKGLMLKQCLRDMENEIAREEEEIKRLEALQERALDDHVRVTGEMHGIEKDLKLALSNERDDIARNLIKKLKPRQTHAEEIDRRIMGLQKDLAARVEGLEEKKRDFERISLDAERFLSEAQARKESEAWNAAEKMAGSLDVSDEEVELELMRRKAAMENVQKGAEQ